MLAELLPAEVAVAETFGDTFGVDLYPEEETVISRAVERRRLEYSTARACARSALIKLGFSSEPILTGPNGAPQWPRGVVGSITHCEGYRAAAVALADSILGIGIDAEPNHPLPDGLINTIAHHDERSRLPRSRYICWDRLLFSAKECVYKIWSPLTGKGLGFEDVSVIFEPGDGSFQANLLGPDNVDDRPQLNTLAGRWLADNGLILTAITVKIGPSNAGFVSPHEA